MHKYRIQIPKTVEDSLRIDQENGDHLWGDALKTQVKNNSVTFKVCNGDVYKLVGYKKVTADNGSHIFHVKLGEHFRRKARFVAYGHKIGR